MLLTMIKDLIDITRGALKSPGGSSGSREGAVVNKDPEAEEQAYQETRREHPGG